MIKNVVQPLLERDDVFFDVETYEKCIKYCQAKYWALFPYQKFIYAFVFMYVDDIPVFNTFVVEMGRGNGKTSGFMPLMDFLLTSMYGVKNYNVDIIANNEDQAKKDFNIVWERLESDKAKNKKTFEWTKALIKNKHTRAELRYNTSNANTKDGKEGGALLFDELHAYEDYSQINVFSSQLGKIKHARTFIITTQGYFRDGPLDDIMALCIQILKTGENDIGYFPFLCHMDSREEVDNPDLWIKANPSIEFMPVLRAQIMKDYIEMKRLSSKRPEFMTKRMNLPDRDDAVTVASWDDICAATYSDVEKKTPRAIPELSGKPCIIGIDYADIRDFASAGLLFKVNGEYVWIQKTWICSNSPFFENIKFPLKNYGLPGFKDFEVVNSSTLSAAAIVDWCMEQMMVYQVQKIVMDTFRFSLFREAFESRGVTVESKQDMYGIVRMIRHLNSINALTAPVIEEAFVNHKINYGNSAIMRWYTNNTSVSIDKMGNKSYGKIEPKLRKNDGFMAFVVAMSARDLLNIQIAMV